MKTFIPGQIASAKDVNDNFAELTNKINTSTAITTETLTAHAGWALTAPSTVRTSGKTHTVSLNIKRTASGFTSSPETPFLLVVLPTTVPAPQDGEIIGVIQFGAYSAPLKYAANGRFITCHPTAAFAVTQNGIGLGPATWIA